MNNRVRSSWLIVLTLWTVTARAQQPQTNDGRLIAEHQENGGKQSKIPDTLFDTEEHRFALNREIPDVLGSDGHMNILKACADVGIICGLELNYKMLKIMARPSPKRRTLYSVFRDALGKEAQILWVAPDYVAGRQPNVLTIRPKQGPTALDRTIVWNVARSEGAEQDVYELSKASNLEADLPIKGGALAGSYSYEKRVQISIRNALNHIAATNKTSWQVVISSIDAPGKIDIYPRMK
ncbi:MAG: hypothetical protein HYX59_05860 [Elusimicrobia bacterium]|nr:hypothetical protein [Elusimicrobiota bacterium]